MDYIPVELKIIDSRLKDWGFPLYGTPQSAGLDLFACIDEPVDIRPGEWLLIPAGFSMWIKNDTYVGLIYPRSSMGHKRGLVMGNGTGVIDADYQGPIFVSLLNRGLADTQTIEPGDRIAQMVFQRIARPAFTEVDNFTNETARGNGGFGSTGV